MGSWEKICSVCFVRAKRCSLFTVAIETPDSSQLSFRKQKIISVPMSKMQQLHDLRIDSSYSQFAVSKTSSKGYIFKNNWKEVLRLSILGRFQNPSINSSRTINRNIPKFRFHRFHSEKGSPLPVAPLPSESAPPCQGCKPIFVWNKRCCVFWFELYKLLLCSKLILAKSNNFH